MPSDSWSEVEKLYQAIVELEPSARQAFLDQSGVDEPLRREVESLLDYRQEGDRLLENGPWHSLPMVSVGSQFASYRLESELGQGGMGKVYRAFDTKLNRTVAIKFLSEDLADSAARLRFQREAQMASSLNHPHIVNVHDAGELHGCHYLVTEFIDGGTLNDWVRAEKRTWREIVELLVGVADGLAAAHAAGILHRDIKPANILVARNGYAKLADFGLAKFSDGVDSGKHTAPGIVIGTIAYMSPEQASGDRLDARSDIFSFGLVLSEMLSGHHAFEGATGLEVLQKIIHGAPAPLPEDVPSRLRMAVERTLEKNPADRYQSMHDLVADLRNVIREPNKTGVARMPQFSFWRRSQLPDSRVARAKRRYLQWSLAGVAIAAIVATTTGVNRYRKAADRQVMRLEMSVAPADGLVDMACPVVALSPDGSRVVYVASQGNTQQLYLRAMDSKEAKPIPGTEGAYCTPFFSPDGQWLGFISSSGSLKKVSLSSGSLINIVSGLGGVLGASWGDDGNIVFASRFTKGIERISESGQSRQFVTTVSPDRGESSHRWPVLLPGSKALLYTVGKESGVDETEIVVQRLDTGERRVLIPGGTFPNYLRSGQLAYIQNGSLMAVDFDARQLEVRGVPVPVEERVRQTSLGAAQLGFSRLGSLVYVSSEGPDAAANNETLVWVDRKGNATPIGAPLRAYEWASLSPDGQTLAVSINGAAKADTWLYDLSRHVLTRLTFGLGFNRFPVWTPDGKRVVFVSTRTSVAQIFWKAADSSGTEDQISMNASRTTIGSISPDGAVLLCSVENPESGADIWAVELSGTHKARPFLQTPFAETAPAISPDGLWVAYVSNESGRNEIYVRLFSGSGQRWQLSTGGGEQAVWAHSGRELFYINGSKMLAVPMTTSHLSPRTFAAGVPQVLFDAHYRPANAPYPNFAVSPDDQRFLMIREETATRVNVVLNLFDDFR